MMYASGIEAGRYYKLNRGPWCNINYNNKVFTVHGCGVNCYTLAHSNPAGVQREVKVTLHCPTSAVPM